MAQTSAIDILHHAPARSYAKQHKTETGKFAKSLKDGLEHNQPSSAKKENQHSSAKKHKPTSDKPPSSADKNAPNDVTHDGRTPKSHRGTPKTGSKTNSEPANTNPAPDDDPESDLAVNLTADDADSATPGKGDNVSMIEVQSETSDIDAKKKHAPKTEEHDQNQDAQAANPQPVQFEAADQKTPPPLQSPSSEVPEQNTKSSHDESVTQAVPLNAASELSSLAEKDAAKKKDKPMQEKTLQDGEDPDSASSQFAHHIEGNVTQSKITNIVERAKKTDLPPPDTNALTGHHALSHSAFNLSPESMQAPPTSPSPNAPVDTKPIPYSTLPVEIGLRALDGTKEISLDLTPTDLGKLNIVISVDDQSSVQISFTAERPHTLALLQHDAPQIRHALEQAGYTTSDTSLQFSLKQDTSSHSGSQQGDHKKPARRSGASTDSDTTIAALPSYSRISLTQLDLSV